MSPAVSIMAEFTLTSVHFVALFYMLMFYLRWKRSRQKGSHCLGRKGLKRLERCAPQVLGRACRRQHLIASWEHRAGCALHYCFCIVYGARSGNIVSLLCATTCICFKWKNLHASPPLRCRMLSVSVFIFIAQESRIGLCAALLLGLWLPVVPPCSLCPHRHG